MLNPNVASGADLTTSPPNNILSSRSRIFNPCFVILIG